MATFKPSGLNHITIRVNDIERAEEFYGTILGFELVRKMGQSMAVYRIGNEDTLVLVEAETSYDPASRDYRVDHFGFFADSAKQVDDLAAYFKEQEVTILSGPANRKRGRFVFVSDPDGNMIEIFYEEDNDYQ
jgi:catechol 2,3-dioxygenase-like lactoylglutathione lyase family enzyme